MPKIRGAASKPKSQLKHDPLAHDILSDIVVTNKKEKNKRKRNNSSDNEQEEMETLDAKISQKIMNEVRKQHDEIENENKERKPTFSFDEEEDDDDLIDHNDNLSQINDDDVVVSIAYF